MRVNRDFEYYKYRLSKLEAKRTNYDPKWNQLAVFCDPRHAYFTVQRTNGQMTQLIPKTDDTVQIYLPVYAAFMNSMVTPQAYLWHQLKFFAPAVQEQFGDWLSAENELLYKYRYAGESNFVSTITEAYISAAVYGHCIIYVEKDRARRRLSYTCLPIQEFYIDKNFVGRINTFYRKVTMPYRQLLDLFPKYVPEKYKKAQDTKWLDENMELLNAVEPSQDKEGNFHYAYIDITNKHIIDEGEMDYCPYICARESVFPSSDDPYGFSRCMSIFPSIKALNALQFNFIKQTDMAGQPTLLTNSDIIDASKVAANGAVIEGGIDDEGRPMVQALRTYADYPALDYEIKMLQDKVKQALHVNFFATFSDTQSRSAEDAAIKASEKANMIAPAGARFARELLVPLIELELKLYGDMNMLPPAPEGLDTTTMFTDFDIVLDNPLLKGQRMDSATNILSLLQSIAQIAGFKQDIIDTVNADKTVRVLQDIMNIPADVINTPEEVAAITREREQVAELQAMVAAAPQVAGAMKDAATAQKLQKEAGAM